MMARHLDGGKEIWGNVKGEMWKMRRTLLPWLHVMIPLLGIAGALCGG